MIKRFRVECMKRTGECDCKDFASLNGAAGYYTESFLSGTFKRIELHGQFDGGEWILLADNRG